MTLDVDRYAREVLRPLRQAPDLLPDSLAARYGVFEPLDEAALADHLAEVRGYWESAGGGVGTLAEVCRRLAAADTEIDPGSLRPGATRPSRGHRPSAVAPEPARPPARPEPTPVPAVKVPRPPHEDSAPPADDVPAAPPQVADARAERFGDHVRISWRWPEAVTTVKVTFIPGRSSAHEIVRGLTATARPHDQIPEGFETRILNRAQYAVDGGCAVPWEGPPGTAQIRSVRPGADGPALSEPVEVRIPRPPTRVTWRAERPRRFAPRDQRRRWIFNGEIDGGGTDVEIIVVAQRGTVIPPRIEQPKIIARERVEGARGEFTFFADVPEPLGSPYSVRCFVLGDGPIEVVDPPFTSLKG